MRASVNEQRRWASGLAVLLTGCLGSAYQVPLPEIERLTLLPPEQRGAQVRVVQLDSGGENFSSTPVAGVAVATTTQIRVDIDDDGVDFPSGNGDGAAGAMVLAVVLVASAVGVAAALSARESERYDGWVAVDPLRTQTYLHRVDGQWLRAPLAVLTPAHLAGVDQARLVLAEGTFEPLGRAPLDRTGFAYGLDIGAASVTNARVASTDPWPWVQARMGGFPIHELGIFGAIGFVFASDQGTLINFRYALEVDVMPIQVELVSFGLYAHVGDNHRLHDYAGATWQAHSLFYGGGLIAEIELTTHLSIAFRGGFSAVHDGPWGILPLGEIGAGVNIY